MIQDKQVYDISFSAEIDAVVMEWHGYATSQQFREGTELMLNTLIQNSTSKVLANIEEMILIGREDQEWLEKEFLPRAIKFGFRSIAILTPKHYFNKVAVESISYKVDREKLIINLFDDMDEAKNWLNESSN